jgi:hypothetical protein
MNERCDSCELDTERHPIEIELTPCGLRLCEDCIHDHHCLACAQESAYEHADWEYSRWRDE